MQNCHKSQINKDLYIHDPPYIIPLWGYPVLLADTVCLGQKPCNDLLLVGRLLGFKDFSMPHAHFPEPLAPVFLHDVKVLWIGFFRPAFQDQDFQIAEVFVAGIIP